jgi:hypothetical protein
VGGLEEAGHKAGHQDFLPQFVVVHCSSLAAGYLHRPLISVCDNADSLRNGLIQHWMLQKKKEIGEDFGLKTAAD